jgi:hypothetical protein
MGFTSIPRYCIIVPIVQISNLLSYQDSGWGLTPHQSQAVTVSTSTLSSHRGDLDEESTHTRERTFQP